MKKILAFILAAITVFSTVGYAAPAVEVAETGEEITETTGDIKTSTFDKAVLSDETSPDYLTALYGEKERFFNAADEQNNLTDTDGTIYVNFTGSAKQVNRKGDLSTDRIYTYIEKFNPEKDESLTLRADWGSYIPDSCFLSGKNEQKATAGVWYEYINSFILDDATLAKIKAVGGTVLPDGYHSTGSTGTFKIAYSGLYSKPKASATAEITSRSGKTVTVSYPEGIEAEAKKALSTYYGEYFGGKVTAITVGDTSVALTFADTNVENVKMPALVNAAKTATYNEVDLSYSVDRYAIYGEKLWLFVAETDSTNTIITDADGNKYIEVKSGTAPKPFFTKSTDLSYTYIENSKSNTNPTIEEIGLALRFKVDGKATTGALEKSKISADRFADVVIPFTLTEKQVTDNPERNSIDFYHVANPFFFKYNAVYAKPVAQTSAEAEITSRSGKTVTVSYPEGIEAEAKKALSTYYGEYFGGKVTAITVGDTSVALTFADTNVEDVKMPALVNAAKTATYNEVDLSYSVDRYAIYGTKVWLYDAATDTSATVGADGVAYKEINVSSSQGSLTTGALASGRVYTLFEKVYENSQLSVRLRNGSALMDKTLLTIIEPNNSTDISVLPNTWSEYKYVFKFDDETNISKITNINVYHSPSGFKLAHNGLYYRPEASATAEITSRSGKTVTVSYPGGIDAEAKKALEAYFDEYFNGKVTALSVGQNEITVTLKNVNVKNVVMPALVNAAKTATYNEVDLSYSADRLAIYGVKDWFFDAEDASNAITDNDGNTYIQAADLAYAYFRTYERAADRTYTYIENLRNDKEGKSTMSLRWNNGEKDTTDTGFSAEYYSGEFTEVTIEFTLTQALVDNEKNKTEGWPDVYHNSRYMSTKYVGIYHKPNAKAADPSVRIISKTNVAVTYPDGIYPEAAKALEAYFGEYFGQNVTALKVNGNTINLTLADNAAKFEIPSIVNASGNATAAAVEVITDVIPETLDEINYSEIHSGIRFKASLTMEQRGAAAEYGWIVARKTVLDGRELTFALDNTGKKTYASAIAFGTTTDGEKIDKWLRNDGSNIIFSGVVTGIPVGMENDVIVARPYIKYVDGGEIFYGAAKESTLAAVMGK